jgi:hypothetical protein
MFDSLFLKDPNLANEQQERSPNQVMNYHLSCPINYVEALQTNKKQ